MQRQLLVNIDILFLVDRDSMINDLLIQRLNEGSPVDHDLKAEALGVILVQSEILVESENYPRHVIQSGDIVKGLSVFLVVFTYESWAHT